MVILHELSFHKTDLILSYGTSIVFLLVYRRVLKNKYNMLCHFIKLFPRSDRENILIFTILFDKSLYDITFPIFSLNKGIQ